MKKIFAILMAAVMMFGAVACGGGNESKAEDGSKVDMSKYPSDINEWSGQNLIDYFTEAGVFVGTKEGDESWLQDHVNYWSGMPVNECAGYWTGDETVMIMMLILKKDLADSSEEQYNEWMTTIKDTKKLPGELSTFAVDHLAGNIAFIYANTTLDEAVYNAMEAAYQDLIKALNVTPEF